MPSESVRNGSTNMWVLVSIFLAILAVAMYLILIEFTSSASDTVLARLFG